MKFENIALGSLLQVFSLWRNSMQLYARIFAIAVAALMSVGTAHAQISVSGGNVTISTSGSYIVTAGNVYNLTIAASNVTLNLNGYNIGAGNSGGSRGAPCQIAASGMGNTCTGTLSGTNEITVTGSNVKISNGSVIGGPNNGIVINPPLGTGADITLSDLLVKDFVGYGVQINGDGATLINVKAVQNGQGGIMANHNVILVNVSANYNNHDGITLGSGEVLENVTANFNSGKGIFANGSATVARSTTSHNGSTGIFLSGVIRDHIAYGNVGDGVNSAGGFGLVIDSVATQNSGNGFALNVHTCYSGLSANFNTLEQIAGGTPLSGTVASCE